MTAIQPVHLHNAGPKVSNLHKGLLFLVSPAFPTTIVKLFNSGSRPSCARRRSGMRPRNLLGSGRIS
jgi:hypothetical protein